MPHVFEGYFFNKSLTEIGTQTGTVDFRVCLTSSLTCHSNSDFGP